MGKLMDSQDTGNEENHDQSYVQMSPHVSPALPLDLSIHNRSNPFQTLPLDLSVKSTHVNQRSMAADNLIDAPRIITEPKTEWHYRSMKDLANKHLPCLAGNGPQRTPIRVSVPSRSDRQLYLGIAITTVDNEPHPSKVIVPAKTKVNTEHLSHNNNLSYLQFDECNPTDIPDVENRCIYSEISPAEYQIERKDVRIYMFNLYQSQLITKEMITDKQLNLCKLHFWLCVRVNNKFTPVSRSTFSSIIEEKKMTTSRPRASHQVNKPTTISVPSAVSNMDVDSDDYSNDDNSFYSPFRIDQSS